MGDLFGIRFCEILCGGAMKCHGTYQDTCRGVQTTMQGHDVASPLAALLREIRRLQVRMELE